MLTVKMAAAELGISVGLVRRLIREERLKATKYGRDWFVDPRSLKHYASLPRARGGRIKGKAIKADSLRRRRDRANASA